MVKDLRILGEGKGDARTQENETITTRGGKGGEGHLCTEDIHLKKEYKKKEMGILGGFIDCWGGERGRISEIGKGEERRQKRWN